MRFSVAALITLAYLATGSAAIKCACNGGTEKSQAACVSLGHRYTSSCGFNGCCLDESEVNSFKAKCNSLGFGFKQCDNCGYCWLDSFFPLFRSNTD